MALRDLFPTERSFNTACFRPCAVSEVAYCGVGSRHLVSGLAAPRPKALTDLQVLFLQEIPTHFSFLYIGLTVVNLCGVGSQPLYSGLIDFISRRHWLAWYLHTHWPRRRFFELSVTLKFGVGVGSLLQTGVHLVDPTILGLHLSTFHLLIGTLLFALALFWTGVHSPGGTEQLSDKFFGGGSPFLTGHSTTSFPNIWAEPRIKGLGSIPFSGPWQRWQQHFLTQIQNAVFGEWLDTFLGLWLRTGVAHCGVGSRDLTGRATKGHFLVFSGLGTLSACPYNTLNTRFCKGITAAVLIWIFVFRGGLPIITFHWPGLGDTETHTDHLLQRWTNCCSTFSIHSFICCSATLLLVNLTLECLCTTFIFQFHWIWHTLATYFFSFHHWPSNTSRARTDQPFSRSGPTSRHSFARFFQGLWFFRLTLNLLLLLQMQSCWGEGWSPAVGAPEVFFPVAKDTSQKTKQHGEQPPMCFGTPAGPETEWRATPKVAKRSLMRAHRRALQTGSAWYRGRHYDLADFERMGCKQQNSFASATLSPAVYQDWQQCNRRHMNKGRLNLWQWNSGGLASSTLDELKSWLVLNCIDIGVIVETRLTFDAQWSDQHWHILHSGEGSHRGKGIMLLISKKFCNLSQMRWQFHDTGRLVHVRIALSPRPLDILACYQHTFQPTRICHQNRERWWTKFDQVLNGLPNRNCLVVLGDFNCSLSSSSGVSGVSQFAWRGRSCSGPMHNDQSRFLSILRGNGLVTLNTWSSALGPTYIHGDQASRIDYVCVRPMYADHTARTVRYLWNSPFLNQTAYGHVPILSSITRYWIPTNDSHKI